MSDIKQKIGKPFRWLGPGTLHIRRPEGGVTVIPPGGRQSIVKAQENLAALGAERIEHLIKEGYAETLNIIDGIIEAVNPSHGSMTAEELAEAQKLAEDTMAAEASFAKQARPQIGPDGQPMRRSDLGAIEGRRIGGTE
ncbi:MAG TPA: hypothetical protein VMW87_03530 [Spirochaetia bacterium]|nr:hypothetical protein [Spirochaetia bacterium]